MKSDNETALTSMNESWSTLRAMKSGSRMIIEGSLVTSSKRNGIVQGMTRTIHSAIEETWDVELEVTHSVLPWIAESAGFLLTRFEGGRDGKTANQRLRRSAWKDVVHVGGGCRVHGHHGNHARGHRREPK